MVVPLTGSGDTSPPSTPKRAGARLTPSQFPTPPPTQIKPALDHFRSSPSSAQKLPRWQSGADTPDFLEKAGIPAVVHRALSPSSPISIAEDNVVMESAPDAPLEGGFYWGEMRRMEAFDEQYEASRWRADVSKLVVPMKLNKQILREDRAGPVDGAPSMLAAEGIPLARHGRVDAEGESEFEIIRDDDTDDDDVICVGEKRVSPSKCGTEASAARRAIKSESSALVTSIAGRRSRRDGEDTAGQDSQSARAVKRLRAGEEGTPLREVSVEVIEGKCCPACGCTLEGGSMFRRNRGSGSSTLNPRILGQILHLMLGKNRPLQHLMATHGNIGSWADVAARVGARREDFDRVRHAASWMQDELPRMKQRGMF